MHPTCGRVRPRLASFDWNKRLSQDFVYTIFDFGHSLFDIVMLPIELHPLYYYAIINVYVHFLKSTCS